MKGGWPAERGVRHGRVHRWVCGYPVYGGMGTRCGSGWSTVVWVRVMVLAVIPLVLRRFPEKVVNLRYFSEIQENDGFYDFSLKSKKMTDFTTFLRN